jgi:hypothetical protein
MSGSCVISENGKADRYQRSIVALFLEHMIEIICALEIWKQCARELLVAHCDRQAGAKAASGLETGV